MRKFLAQRGLAFKMVFLIFLSITLVLAVIYAYMYNSSAVIIKRNITANAENLTRQTVSEIEAVLKAVQKVPFNLAEVIRNHDLTLDETLDLIRVMVKNNEEIHGMALAFEPNSINKDSYYYSPYFYKTNGEEKLVYLGNENYNYFLMDWYQIPKELGEPYWTEPYFDEGGGEILKVSYSCPLYKESNGVKIFIGVLTADISLDWLHEIVSGVKIYETGYAYLISKSGKMVTHPIKSLIMNESIFSLAEEKNFTVLRDVGRQMIRGKESFAEVEYTNVATGKKSWLSYAPVKTNGWSLGIVYPVDEMMADVNGLFINVFIFGLSGTLVILLIIIFISKSITKPLGGLTKVAVELTSGNFDVEIPPVKSKDEIATLSGSFRNMRDRLAKTINDLKVTSDNLKLSNIKLEEYSQNLEDKVEERTAELKDKNLELDKSFKSIKTLSELGQKITSTLKISNIQEMVYSAVNSLLDATVFIIMIYNEKADQLECILSMEKSQSLELFNVSMKEKNRFPVWCARHRKAIFMNDVDIEFIKYVPFRAAPKAGEYISSLVYIPLVVEDKLIGVISAQSFKKNAYTQQDFDIFNNLANYVAIAISNASSYEEIRKANKELKETQSQLIQAEKMASLGQLTAGIAHEIKNPLNFINNFAELSVGLAEEIKEEIDKQSPKFESSDYEYLQEIIRDLYQNSKKINEHGKRADSIVKGMLLHSRGKSGEMQKTDINSLLAEYVSLAYHGMRAQDSSFNVKLESDYDPSLAPINVVPQNISRVFLNTVNNACYATNEKKKEKGDAFSPVVSVATKDLGNKVEVRIRDNGKGISKENIDKIFNPFFTTKPTGKGTGLGLSLSFDIVVQEHRGEIRVESEEGEYAEFIITIPKNL
ncbi:MAG: cache domain-containing protein [Ignavibacteriaceae bacterium]